MDCPKCGSGNGYVMDSRRAGGTVKRRRRCLDCGHRYSTMEVDAEKLRELERTVAVLRLLQEKIEELREVWN